MRHKSKLSPKDKKVSSLHIEIVLVLDDLISAEHEHKALYEADNFIASSGYAEAVLEFREQGIDPNKWWFSTNNVLLLKYAEQLKEKYKVAIYTVEAGMAREKALREERQPVERSWCMGAPMFSNKYHQGEEITDREWYNLKPQKKSN